MPRFKVGDTLKHKKYTNIREILEVHLLTYKTRQLTPGNGARFGTERYEPVVYIDQQYEYSNPVETFVRAKLKSMGYGR